MGCCSPVGVRIVAMSTDCVRRLQTTDRTRLNEAVPGGRVRFLTGCAGNVMGWHLGRLASRRVRRTLSAIWRGGSIPDSRIHLGYQRPHLAKTVLDGVDDGGEVAEDHELVGNHTASRVSASERILDAKRNMSILAVPRSQRVSSVVESTFVVRERVAESGVEKKTKTPITAPSGPDDVRGSGTGAHFGFLITLSSTPCSRSNLNCVSVARR